jgi:signal peptidase I
MRTFVKIAIRAVLILVVFFVLFVLVVRSLFIVSPMRTGSMQPLIASNDIVIAAKWFKVASLRNGDLVVVALLIPGGSKILTIRKIEQQTNTPAGQFYLIAASTNGIDSRRLGAFQTADIRGRVIRIFRGVY